MYNLINVATVVSNIGNEKIIGNKIRSIGETTKLSTVKRDKVAAIKPKNKVPESPKKVIAGCQFQKTNPNNAPIKIAK